MLHIVYIDSAAYPRSVDAKTSNDSLGTTPQTDDVKAAVDFANANKIALRVYLVDPQYYHALEKIRTLTAPPRPMGAMPVASILKPTTYSLHAAYQADMKRIQTYPANSVMVIAKHASQWKPGFTEGDSVIYIYGGDNPRMNSAYRIMDYVEDLGIDKRWYIPLGSDGKTVKCAVTVLGLVTEWFARTGANGDMKSGMLPPASFNFYGGEELKGVHPSGDLDDVKTMTKTGCDALSQYLTLGMHSSGSGADAGAAGTSNFQPDNWIFNVESPPIKGFILYYGLIPDVADIDPQLAMNYNADYRRLVVNTIARGLANLVINNKLLTVAQVAQSGGWLVPATWTAISAAVDKWNLAGLAQNCAAPRPASPVRTLGGLPVPTS